MPKKYQTLEELCAAAKSGEFTGHIIVDNDCVGAYQPMGDDDSECVFDFGGEGPEGALIDILTFMGLDADRS